MRHFINTSRNIYLVKFKQNYKTFIIQCEELLDLLKYHNDMSIEYVKIFESEKNRFVNLSKSDLKRFSDWQTELKEILISQKAI